MCLRCQDLELFQYLILCEHLYPKKKLIIKFHCNLLSGSGETTENLIKSCFRGQDHEPD